ncbi:MAG: chorismate synthase [Dehalococcoidia bacterium]|nr:chorismate synthase [Dehalococcoidia bacterium]
MSHFRFLTAGESHGKGLVAVVEGVPAGIPITEDLIAADLSRRQGGYGRGKRQQIEQDRAEIISGVRHGLSIGSPIALSMPNRDHENANWRVRMATEPVDEEVERVTLLRPGHADLAGTQKYGFDDVRPILERSSARETAARVAVGAIARALAAQLGIEVRSHTIAIGSVRATVPERIDWAAVDASPVRVADRAVEQAMVDEVDRTKEALDTVGGVFEVRASGLPFGLGSHVHWDRKLDGRLGQAILSINAVKAVEVGDGIAGASLPGSEVQDVILPVDAWERRPWERATNRAGGLEGGMTNGEDVVVRGFIKPISTVPRRLPTADLLTGEETTSFYERSDVAVVPAAGVIGEAMVAIVLADAILEKFGGDHVDEIRRNCAAFMATVGPSERPRSMGGRAE